MQKLVRLKKGKISCLLVLILIIAGSVFFFLPDANRFCKQIDFEKKGRVPLISDRPTYAATHHNPRHKSKVIRLYGAHDLTIANQNIAGGRVSCIVLYNCYNIKILHNKLTSSSETGISLYGCYNIDIRFNYFANVSTGVYAVDIRRGRIVVNNNSFLNMQGPYPRGQCVQFDKVNGAGNEICFNKCENIAGKSNPEDAISLYKSNGTAESAIMVEGNRIRGGGPSKSGGGIMLGDSGGSYQIALKNILVDPGQYGIAISGGDRNAVVGNYIFGRPQRFTNVGIYVAGYNGAKCTNSTVEHNKVNYFNNQQKPNHSWIGPNTSMPSGWETNIWGAPIGPDVFSKVK
ncbi:right-handed parallel beta-helix repeat-containing protein [Mucilaginibacter sp. L3T2-6]|uniref:right-handed parallel beta-helix repeat-containing protein n=1 Tax=Mucilaginibacter sp. L3T2-6 TaxID=3062491 RepID=UPI0026754A22|nr:right-handed parallel beta-helix repeat-containing protein [Mucilaginibacter sp. L3T2-6]MDO3643693.1 right-handed parallel beta-helix repeat-containing protein [Mucilaginibacter sp. L3T2-6]MDV6216059.1 right-handed parallel beta-helix repeat-containing protein [Mucilaginibacter sp. L3T2-6]